ncbi:MAG: hypothetical protein JWP28_2541 [Phenylobacterium sp.]|uniref:hypothetical protein n=1 Tax=Phenylobacterium sp. TaxID=1871053 RepID=UPI002635C764|nr:hypothetical protein [Phenylobacterium sp.]MDB5498510.1 hypothetical protein [Phenylobacterium sp.]
MFQAFTKPGAKVLVPLLTEEADHSEKSTLAGGVFVSTFDLDETVDIEATWSPSGEVTITLRDKVSRSINSISGFERRTVKMRGGPPTRLTVVAISGEAEWKPLEIGTVAPLP